MTPVQRPWLVLGILPLLAHCASAPRLDGVTQTYAIPPAASSRLDDMVKARVGDRPAVSSVQLLQQNAVAFAFRAGTAAAAERSLDVQYYVWQDDLTGRLLVAALMRAADHGVRVRLLLDDLDARTRHDLFMVVDLHPNLEVRIFNPFYSRYGTLGKAMEFLVRGTRLNHRMHNKAWIADNRIAIIGGRNVGDEYFGASRQSNFSDTDLVLAGPVVEQVSREFDEYWNSPDAIPVSAFDVRKPTPADLQELQRELREFEQHAEESSYVLALRDPDKRQELIAGMPPPIEVRDIRVLVDDPSKVGTSERGLRASQVLDGLSTVMGEAQSELLIVSPYFVPGKQGAETLSATAQRGVRVEVLTNSLAATDVVAVHVGYARYRRELLKAGVELHEMKRSTGEAAANKHVSVLGSKRASLHTKAMIVDSRWSFVGSMNIDPRSANLNTEMGVLVDSPDLAAQLRAQFEAITSPELSYRVVMDPKHGLTWHDRKDGEQRMLEREPDASVSRRIGATLLRALPMESQL
jgi:putative cardiolipin synthase